MVQRGGAKKCFYRGESDLPKRITCGHRRGILWLTQLIKPDSHRATRCGGKQLCQGDFDDFGIWNRELSLKNSSLNTGEQPVFGCTNDNACNFNQAMWMMEVAWIVRFEERWPRYNVGRNSPALCGCQPLRHRLRRMCGHDGPFGLVVGLRYMQRNPMVMWRPT